MDENSSDPLVPPPDAQRVAKRAMVLSAIVCRSNSDYAPENPDAIDLWERLKRWAEVLEISSEMEPYEREMLYSPLGTLEEKARIRVSWHAEGLAIIAWALGRFNFPKKEEKVDPFELTDSLWFLHKEAIDVIKSAKLRPSNELDACRDYFYAIHCRIRDYQRTKSVKNIEQWIEMDWLKTLGVDSPLGLNHDFLIGGVEISAANDEIIRQTEEIICERHRAIIWLSGEGGPLYSQVTVDT